MVTDNGLDQTRTERVLYRKQLINIEIDVNPPPASVNFPVIGSKEVQ